MKRMEGRVSHDGENREEDSKVPGCHICARPAAADPISDGIPEDKSQL